MQHKNIRGKLAYTSKQPEMMNQSRGHELFHITKHTDGQITLRAHCEIEEPDPTVMRDVVLTLNENNHPMDCFIRLTVGDKFMGSGLFIFDLDEECNGTIECESYGPSIGRHSEKKRNIRIVRCFWNTPNCWRRLELQIHEYFKWTRHLSNESIHAIIGSSRSNAPDDF
jgi:hypothetical protein